MFRGLWSIYMCHGHTKRRLRRSTNDEAMTDKAMNVEQEVTRLGTLEVVQDETINFGSYGEREDKDDDQRDKMRQNENYTRLICQ